MRIFATRARRIAAATLVSAPFIGFGGLSAYIQYRKRTKPQPHMFRPMVDDNGDLQLEGRVVPRPSTMSVVVRAIHLVLLFVPLAFLYVFMSLRSDWYHVWINLLLKAVQRAGPVFVKIGQWSCTREDLFSPEVRQVFKRLYNEVDVHPYEASLQILSEELGRPALEVFESIDEKTVGSGSIGQVHLAKLKGSSRRVVIKVMHPGIIETIVRDFTILNNLADFADRYIPGLSRFDLPELSLAFTSHLAAQLDFRVEAENLEAFRRNFGKEPYVEFPEPLLSTQRMLVETFCEGEPASPEFLRTLPVHARDTIANKGLNTWCQMLLRDNFIHGDMHPGNILIDASDSHNPTITLIDVGLCQQLTPEESKIAHNLMESFVRWNPAQCADSLWNMGRHQRYADKETFEANLTELFKHFRPTRGDKQAVTNILQAIFETVRQDNVHMDPAFVSLLFAVLVLESFIMNLNPEYDMVRHTAPWLVTEGHISKGVVKNLAKSARDNLLRDYYIWSGRMEDTMELERLEASSENIRVSNADTSFW
uniref:Ubiquinone biosynthesis protein n=1 Tax=Herpetomonas muscarum TaxID=5718 RepID=T1YU62_HERMU|nr:ubiquinone biosynthesis protein [Herpetomonas muscarum]